MPISRDRMLVDGSQKWGLAARSGGAVPSRRLLARYWGLAAMLPVACLAAPRAGPAVSRDSPAASAVPHSNAGPTEVWLAPRSDGKPGSGTPGDPYNASTAANFDPLMDSCGAGVTIHLAPGRYFTRGSYGWHVKARQLILGAGKDVTVITLTNLATSAWVIDGQVVTNRDVTVADLTVDCNFPGLKPAKASLGGVVLFGDRATIRGVKVINAGTTAWECFPLSVGLGQGGLIQNCEVDRYQGGGATAIHLGSNATNAVVMGNRVVLAPKPGIIQNGLGFGSVRGAYFIDNWVSNVTYAVFSDTGRIGSSNVYILNNRFILPEGDGVHLDQIDGSPAYGRIVVAGNDIAVKSGWCGIRLWPRGTPQRFNDVVVHHNVFRLSGSAGPPEVYAVDIVGGNNITIFDNVIAYGMTNYFRSTTNLVGHGNRDSRGNKAAGLPER